MLKWRYRYILLISNGNDNNDTKTSFEVVCLNIMNLRWLTNLLIMKTIENILVNSL